MARKLILISVFLWLVLSVSPVTAKSYSAERYDVSLTVLPGGEMLVKETIHFNFQGGPYTYVFRHLALTRTDGIDQISASMDGLSLSSGTAPGQVEIEQGNPIKVTWHFDPVSDSTHIFELTYRVRGVIRSGETDTLVWLAIPEEHEYEIAHSLVTLEYPQSIAIVDPPTLDGAEVTSEQGEGKYTLADSEIPADQPLTITANFPAGSLVQSPPQWQQQSQRMAQETKSVLPIGIAAGMITLSLSVGGLFLFFTRNRRENYIPPDPGMRLVSPPSKVSPLMAAKLAGGDSPVLALLFDLAQRGFLTIEEGKGLLGAKTYLVQQTPNPAPLLPIEQDFMHVLFTTSKGDRDSLPLSEVATKVAMSGKSFSKALDEAMVTDGWIDPDRKKKRDRLVILSVLLMIFGSICFAAGFVLGSVSAASGNWAVFPYAAGMVGFGTGAFVGSLISTIAGAFFSPLTNQGVYEQSRWKGFQSYLKDITRGKEAITTPDLFERYLPYVVGLGVAQGWAKKFHQTGQVQIPLWFNSLNQDFDRSDFGSFVAMMSASDSASSSASGGDGGGGASGGGSSGAG